MPKYEPFVFTSPANEPFRVAFQPYVSEIPVEISPESAPASWRLWMLGAVCFVGGVVTTFAALVLLWRVVS